MKYVILILILTASLCACVFENPKQVRTEVVAPQDEIVKLVVLADRSGSFVEKYELPRAELFKPLCDRICKSATLDFRYGCITAHSDIVLHRYYVPFVEQKKHATNPWLTSEKKAPATEPSDWNEFAASVNAKLALPPSQRSDVANALKRAIACFQESDDTRNILVLCTDGKDTYGGLPAVPHDIEIIAVGILPDNHIEQALQTTNIKRFESLQSAIEYLSLNTFKNE